MELWGELFKKKKRIIVFSLFSTFKIVSVLSALSIFVIYNPCTYEKVESNKSNKNKSKINTLLQFLDIIIFSISIILDAKIRKWSSKNYVHDGGDESRKQQTYQWGKDPF